MRSTMDTSDTADSTGARTSSDAPVTHPACSGDDFHQRRFAYRRCADQDALEPPRHPVVVVGAGPVGLATAIDLALHDVPVVLVDDDDCLSAGSRAICFAKRTLEIFDRLGCCAPMMEKGVRWNLGKVFFRDQPVYSFNLLPEEGHAHPAFINLQQYYVEGFLQARAAALPRIDLRWKSRVTGLLQDDEDALLTVETPEGSYRLRADYVVAADGVRSPVRALMGLESRGRVFNDRFLIADVKMKAEFPTERWFWFDPPFHPNQSVLLHRQPDNVWRIDFQLGADADPAIEKLPERVIPRVRALLGQNVEFTLEWVSVYTFACRRMAHFRHGRVLFAGDAAHGVSPFGARGANSGIQDADNLAWKLAQVVQGHAGDALLDTYAHEREQAADENILNSTRSTDFITPKSPISRLFRDATLALAKHHAFARRLVNSGRLSLPTTYAESPLNTPDADAFADQMCTGAPCADAPVRRLTGADGRENNESSDGNDGMTGGSTHSSDDEGDSSWFLRHVGGRFAVVLFAAPDGSAALAASLASFASLAPIAQPVLVVPAPAEPAAQVATGCCVLEDVQGLLAARYDARPGTLYLLRPDQHVCARWRSLDAAAVRRAWERATGVAEPAPTLEQEHAA